jgi:GAF domain-containing protein
MNQDLPLAGELSAVFARMSGLLLSEETVSTALRLVTSLAKDTIPATLGAGVTLIDERGLKTSAASSDAAVEQADGLQYELNEGPCLTAWADKIIIRVDDTCTDSRWARWCPSAVALGMRAALSSPLVAGNLPLGAIKVYSDKPDAYDERSERLLSMFAAQAAILLANVQSYAKAQQLTEDLKEALRSRDVIGAAKGIVMARDGVDEEAAFATLVNVSQRENQKLRDVAEALVRSTVRRRR